MFCTTPFQPRKSRGEGSKASVQIRRLALVEMVSMPTVFWQHPYHNLPETNMFAPENGWLEY